MIKKHTLKYNRAFLESAIMVDPGVLHHSGLSRDFELNLLAVGSSRAALMQMQHSGSHMIKLVAFAGELRDVMQLSEAFVFEFLEAISIQLPPAKKRGCKKRGQLSKTCHLHLLDLGGETVNFLKRSIAEFAGAPMGPKYKLMRNASEHLALWGY